VLANQRAFRKSKSSNILFNPRRVNQVKVWTKVSKVWLKEIPTLMISCETLRLRMRLIGQVSSIWPKKTRKKHYWQNHPNTVRMRWSCLRSSAAANSLRTSIPFELNKKELRMLERIYVTNTINFKREKRTRNLGRVTDLNVGLNLYTMKYLIQKTLPWFSLIQTVSQMWLH